MENIREVVFDLENLPSSLVFKLEEVEFTYSAAAFGFGEHLKIEYYEQKFERAFPGLLAQFPMLYYMVEDWFNEGIKLTPLEHIMTRKKSYFFEKNDDTIMCLTEEEILLDGRQLRNNKYKDI